MWLEEIVVTVLAVLIAFLSYIIHKINRQPHESLRDEINSLYNKVRRMENTISEVEELVKSKVSRIIIPKQITIVGDSAHKYMKLAETLHKLHNVLEARILFYIRKKPVVSANEQIKIDELLIDEIDYKPGLVVDEYIAVISLQYSDEYRDRNVIVSVSVDEPYWRAQIHERGRYLKLSGTTEVPLYLYNQVFVVEPGKRLFIEPAPEKLIVVRAVYHA